MNNQPSEKVLEFLRKNKNPKMVNRSDLRKVLGSQAASSSFWDSPCEHRNSYYFGDTHPVTYKCADCGNFFVKND